TFAINPTDVRNKKLLPWLVTRGLVLPSLLAALYVWKRWRKLGRDPRGRGVIVPEYVPPKGLNALTSDVIVKEYVRTSAVTALIIVLAIKGYLRIHETSGKGLLKKAEYELELVKALTGLSTEEREVLKAFFGDGLII